MFSFRRESWILGFRAGRECPFLVYNFVHFQYCALYLYSCSKHSSKQTKQLNTSGELHTSKLSSSYLPIFLFILPLLLDNQEWIFSLAISCISYENATTIKAFWFCLCSFPLYLLGIFLKLFYFTSIFR